MLIRTFRVNSPSVLFLLCVGVNNRFLCLCMTVVPNLLFTRITTYKTDLIQINFNQKVIGTMGEQ